MPETKTEQRVIRTDMTCNDCGNGVMRPTGVMLSSHPPQFAHACTNCGAQHAYRVNYPAFTYEDLPAQ
jgi:transcription elongation factor Elf1